MSLRQCFPPCSSSALFQCDIFTCTHLYTNLLGLQHTLYCGMDVTLEIACKIFSALHHTLDENVCVLKLKEYLPELKLS